jgi:hypothetical protein
VVHQLRWGYPHRLRVAGGVGVRSVHSPAQPHPPTVPTRYVSPPASPAVLCLVCCICAAYIAEEKDRIHQARIAAIPMVEDSDAAGKEGGTDEEGAVAQPMALESTAQSLSSSDVTSASSPRVETAAPATRAASAGISTTAGHPLQNSPACALPAACMELFTCGSTDVLLSCCCCLRRSIKSRRRGRGQKPLPVSRSRRRIIVTQPVHGEAGQEGQDGHGGYKLYSIEDFSHCAHQQDPAAASTRGR